MVFDDKVKILINRSITWIFLSIALYLVLVGQREHLGIKFYLIVGGLAVLVVGVIYLLRSKRSSSTSSTTATSSVSSTPAGISPLLVAFGFLVVVITMARLQNITPAGIWEKYSSSPKYPQCGSFYVVTATPQGSPEVIRPPRCTMRYNAQDTMDVYVVMTPFDTLTAGPNHTIHHPSLPRVSFRSFKGKIKIGVELIPK
jgi:hypothetical protein